MDDDLTYWLQRGRDDQRAATGGNPGGPMDDETLAALDADAHHWYTQEDADTWQLFRGVYQIIKAPKHGTDYAEYWPPPADSAYIVQALNAYPALLAEVAELRAVIAELRNEVGR